MSHDTFPVPFILRKERLIFSSYRISNLNKPSSQNVNAIALWFRMFSFLHRHGFLFIASSNLSLRGVHGKIMYTNTIMEHITQKYCRFVFHPLPSFHYCLNVWSRKWLKYFWWISKTKYISILIQYTRKNNLKWFATNHHHKYENKY